MTSVCFDLDGTLADSAEGIICSLNHALEAQGIDSTRVDWRRFVGPPLRSMIAAALPDVLERQATDVIAAFRKHYATTGLFRTIAFAGIGEMLESLAARGSWMYVVTNKPQPQAEAVLEHLGFAGRFRRIVGGDPAGRVTKVERAAELKKVDNLENTTFVGDSIDDLRAADRMKAKFVLATWGYGTADVLAEQPDVTLAHMPLDLLQLIELKPSSGGR